MTVSVESGPGGVAPERWGKRVPGKDQRTATHCTPPLFAIFVLRGWEYVCHAFKISELIIPAPSQIVVALIEGFQADNLSTDFNPSRRWWRASSWRRSRRL